MEIRVKCGCGEGGCPEWAILELQGVVEAQPAIGDRIRNIEIGKLCCSSQGSYTLTVGYHELSGTKVALKKPLLVLQKKKASAAEDQTDSPEDSQRTELEVIGIIRQKILFKGRPKPLISSKPQAKEKKMLGGAGSSGASS